MFVGLTIDEFIGRPIFLYKSSLQSNDQPQWNFQCARSRCKTCPFIHNVEKISGPKRSIKITDHFTCSAADVSYCITYTYCKKVYIGETGRRLGNRFWEHHDVDRNDKDASKPVADTLISLLILSSIWQFAAFPHIQAVRKASNSFTKLIFQIGTLNPHGINERFSFD